MATTAQYAGESMAARQPEVVAEMERLTKAVDTLGAVSDTLAARLNPVRRQVGNLAGKGEANAPDAVLCGMAEVIRQQRRNVEHHIGVLQTALNELEI